MKSTLDQIEDIRKNGYSLDFSNVFNHAFENYKKIALYAGLILLVFAIIAVFLGGGVFVALYGVEHFTEEYFKSLQNEQPAGGLEVPAGVMLKRVTAGHVDARQRRRGVSLRQKSSHRRLPQHVP